MIPSSKMNTHTTVDNSNIGYANVFHWQPMQNNPLLNSIWQKKCNLLVQVTQATQRPRTQMIPKKTFESCEYEVFISMA